MNHANQCQYLPILPIPSDPRVVRQQGRTSAGVIPRRRSLLLAGESLHRPPAMFSSPVGFGWTRIIEHLQGPRILIVSSCSVLLRFYEILVGSGLIAGTRGAVAGRCIPRGGLSLLLHQVSSYCNKPHNTRPLTYIT